MNKRPYYTFRVSIRKDEPHTIIDTAISGSTPAEIGKAKADVIRLIDSYTPEGIQAAPAPAPVALQPGTTLDLDPESQAPIDPTASPEWKNPADRLNTAKAEVEIRPTTASGPAPAIRPRKKPRGAMFLQCPECGRRFGTFLKEPADAVECRCGHSISLDNIARYTYTCPCCERTRYGWTNLEDPDITQACVCGNEVSLSWNKAAREYQG